MAFKKNEAPAKESKEEKKEVSVIFPEGLMVFPPHERAPDWVHCDLVLNIEKFEKWVAANPDLIQQSEKYGAQIRFVLKSDKADKLYLSVNNYRKES